ncbi:MAG: hypothetical protein OXE52_00880, partial [Chloroflexi bacterium]|nr:hypothetical protein [Chloroflexota bacterium]
MQRNIGNELVVALFALAALLFALAFAIILSTATRGVSPPGPTDVPTALSSPTATAETSTPLSPAATVAETAATITITPSATDLPPGTETMFASPSAAASATASASPMLLFATDEARVETPDDSSPPSTVEKRTALAKTSTQEEPIAPTKELDSVSTSPIETASAVHDKRDTPSRTPPATGIGVTEEVLDVQLTPFETPGAPALAEITGTASPIRRTPVVRAMATDVASPTATDEIAETATSEARDVRADRTALAKRTPTATASSTTTDVASPTATDEIAETAASVERDIRADRTALVKRTATATASSTTTDVASPTVTDEIAETATSV